jgi:hypothetical protein
MTLRKKFLVTAAVFAGIFIAVIAWGWTIKEPQLNGDQVSVRDVKSAKFVGVDAPGVYSFNRSTHDPERIPASMALPMVLKGVLGTAPYPGYAMNGVRAMTQTVDGIFALGSLTGVLIALAISIFAGSQNSSANSAPNQFAPLSQGVSPKQQPNVSISNESGIAAVYKLCSGRRYRIGFLENDPLLSEAVTELQRAGPNGSRVMAAFIDELLTARCAEIEDALAVARRLSPEPELVSAIQRVCAAPPLTRQAGNPVFPPVIAGDGKIGWDDSTASHIKRLASKTLDCLNTDVREGVVEELSTMVVVQGHLMWQKECDGTQRTQKDALTYCRDLSLAGYNDWRLPSLQEFR